MTNNRHIFFIYSSGEIMRLIKYVIKSIIIGIVSILVINFIGQFFNFMIPFNFINIALIGFFYIPGLILVLLLLIL